MGITSGLVDFAVAVIERLGYMGVFVLMVMESMIFPVPSEGVMPFAGFLVADGRMDLMIVSGVATLGSIVGSYLSYEMGRRWGRPFVDRYGKWFLLSQRDLDWTERFFARWGAWAVLAGRLIPVVRHLISIPAGLAKMRLVPFFAATIVGAFAWNFFLTWVGMQLGRNWPRIKDFLQPIDYAVVALLVLAGVAYVVIHIKRAKAHGLSPVAAAEENV